MASGAWLRTDDERAAECEVSRIVSEAPAGSEADGKGEGKWKMQHG